MHGVVSTFVGLCLTSSTLASQDPGTRANEPPTQTEPTQIGQQEADSKGHVKVDATGQRPAVLEPLPAIVIDVRGVVEWAAAGVSPIGTDGWTAVRISDKLDPTTQIRTGLRSFVTFQFGETTTMSIRSITFASIAQFYRSAKTENVRIDLGYGTVRGGSSEGEFRSDVIVDSPVATLAKRGTEGWEINVEPGTRRFRISLAEHGLVDARQKLIGGRAKSRLVRPGEYVTETNIANLWINQDIFNRVVAFYSPGSVTEADAAFDAANNSGYAVLAPGGGSAVFDLSGRVNAEFVLSQIAASGIGGGPLPTLAIGRPGVIGRPEGNFGTSRTFKALAPVR